VISTCVTAMIPNATARPSGISIMDVISMTGSPKECGRRAGPISSRHAPDPLRRIGRSLDPCLDLGPAERHERAFSSLCEPAQPSKARFGLASDHPAFTLDPTLAPGAPAVACLLLGRGGLRQPWLGAGLLPANRCRGRGDPSRSQDCGSYQ
jgi:hypothetical protein